MAATVAGRFRRRHRAAKRRRQFRTTRVTAKLWVKGRRPGFPPP
jgi:hypothetical protein